MWWVCASLIRSRVEPYEVGVFESDQVTHGAMRGGCASLIRSLKEPCVVGVCKSNQVTRGAMRGGCVRV